MIRALLVLICALGVLFLASSPPVSLGQEPPKAREEYDIKADYLALLSQYVEWPKNGPAGDDFAIGVVGPNVFGKYLDGLTTKTVNNKKIVVHRFASAKDYDKPCHLLFIAADDMTEARLTQVLEKTKNAPVLLVSDTVGFARKGVVFNLILKEGYVKVEMNPDAAKRANLKLKSPLFSIPKTVTIVNDAPGGT